MGGKCRRTKARLVNLAIDYKPSNFPEFQSDNTKVNMAHQLYTDETPGEVKNAKGLHLITQNTPNGQAVQIFLEELKDAYGTEWTTSVIDISTNIQKADWFLRLDPNGSPAVSTHVNTLLNKSRSHPSPRRQHTIATIHGPRNLSRALLPTKVRRQARQIRLYGRSRAQPSAPVDVLLARQRRSISRTSQPLFTRST